MSDCNKNIVEPAEREVCVCTRTCYQAQWDVIPDDVQLWGVTVARYHLVCGFPSNAQW